MPSVAAAIFPAETVGLPDVSDTTSGAVEVSVMAKLPPVILVVPPTSPKTDPIQGSVVIQLVLFVGGL
jgi:hypothetical protein